MTGINSIDNLLERLVQADPDVVRHAATVSVWARWFVWITSVGLLAYRPSLWFPHDIGYVFLNAALAISTGIVHYRLLTNRPVTWRWMLFLSAMDVALLTGTIAVSGRFNNYIFLGYFPALTIFTVVFTSFRINMAWTTMVASSHVAVSLLVGSGLDFNAGDERALFARVVAMYLIVAAIGLVIQFERGRRRAATARERQAHQERIEFSQSVHDTMAQTAYMIGLGIEGSMKLVGDSNPQLTEKLAATAALSRSAMWELRGPIDLGRIFEGRDLSRVLGAHTATFAAITSVPVEMIQSGEEPPLSTEVKTGLLSIAHNALTNAYMHAQAGGVEVRLDFGPGQVRLSVSDDGVGLPEDYAERGHGFSGMMKDAERMGGSLSVEERENAEGTTVICVVPLRSGGNGD